MDQPLPTSDSVDLARVARLVRPFEALEARAIRRPGGGWSIGYGHVRSARAGAEVTRDEAEALLLYDLRQVALSVRSAIYAPINRNQLEALIAFAFHIGTDNFLSSTALQRFNAGDGLGAALEIERWRCADLGGEAQVVDALVRRRAAEKAHFLTPPEGFLKASRVRLEPQFDLDSPVLTSETPDGGASATLAAAHSVSARLRALVPDLVDQPEPPPAVPEVDTAAVQKSETAAVRSLAETVGEPQPSSVAPVVAVEAPVLMKAFAAPEPEIPPPPMPSESTLSVAPNPVAQNPATHDVWPSSMTTEARAGDPFSQDPLDAASIEAPPLDRSAAASSLFRAKPQHRVQIPPKPAQGGAASALRLNWTNSSRPLLWACLALGLAAFIWSIWSILETSPGAVNFAVGLMGIAVMAVPGYLLLGANAVNASAARK